MAHRRRLAVRLTSLALVALIIVGAGCSDEKALPDEGDTTTTAERTGTESIARPTSTSQPEPPTTSDGPSTTSKTPTDDERPSDEQEIVDRYLGFWQARLAANSGTPNPADPALAEFATGEQLDAVVAETQLNLERGLSYREADDPVGFQRVQVLSIENDLAVVQECVVDDGIVVRTDSGEVVDADVTTHNVRGELVREGDQWRVSRVEAIQVWEGVAGCASGS